jgi:hypothetical protein
MGRDTTPIHQGDETADPAPGSNTMEATLTQFTMVDRWLGMARASWDASALADLDAICRMGAVPASGEPGGIVSKLRGPLELGSSVSRFEMRLGARNVNTSDPPRHFLA